MVGKLAKNHLTNMEQDKQHLDIDLEFLDKDSSKKDGAIRNETRKNTSVPKLKLSKSQIKKYLIIGGVVIFFGWVIFSDNNSSTSTTNTGSYTPSSVNQASSDSDTFVIGEYRCSRYNYDKAVTLAPSESEQQIDTARNALEYKSNELDRLKNEIDSSYVNEYSSQYEINQYNATVNEYNSKLASYKRDETSFSSRVDRYNAQVEAHNNYLRNNCTLNR
jgi:hypothetical protein